LRSLPTGFTFNAEAVDALSDALPCMADLVHLSIKGRFKLCACLFYLFVRISSLMRMHVIFMSFCSDKRSKPKCLAFE
jgi:hypothetical protein